MAEKRRRKTFHWNPVKKKQRTETTSLALVSDKCCFCHEGENTECGTFFRESNVSLAAHQFCLFFSAGLPQLGDDTEGFDGFLYKDILKEAQRANKICCKFCQLPGASSGCSVKSCKVVFHYKCGTKEGTQFIFYDCFDTYCKIHRSFQDLTILKKARCLSNPYLCPLCFEEVTYDYNFTLKTPCCNNVFIHKSCIQRQASISGYFFRCPICNNSEEFTLEMSKYGVYIPSRDAAWEANNAFQDLLEVYQRCDATVCICPSGKSYVEDNGDWEIVRCYHCGQCGIHRNCLGSNIVPSYDFICRDCNKVIGALNSPPVVSPDRHDHRFWEHKKRLTELREKKDPVLLASPVFAPFLWIQKFNVRNCKVVVKQLPMELIGSMRCHKMSIEELISNFGITVTTPTPVSNRQQKQSGENNIPDFQTSSNRKKTLNGISLIQEESKKKKSNTQPSLESEFGTNIVQNYRQTQLPLLPNDAVSDGTVPLPNNDLRSYSKTAAKIMACVASSQMLKVKRPLAESENKQGSITKKIKLETSTTTSLQKIENNKQIRPRGSSKLLIKFQFGHNRRKSQINRDTVVASKQQTNEDNMNSGRILPNSSTILVEAPSKRRTQFSDKNSENLMSIKSSVPGKSAGRNFGNTNSENTIQSSSIILEDPTKSSINKNEGNSSSDDSVIILSTPDNLKTTNLSNNISTASKNIKPSSSIILENPTKNSVNKNEGNSSSDDSVIILSSPENPKTTNLSSNISTASTKRTTHPSKHFKKTSNSHSEKSKKLREYFTKRTNLVSNQIEESNTLNSSDVVTNKRKSDIYSWLQSSQHKNTIDLTTPPLTNSSPTTSTATQDNTSVVSLSKESSNNNKGCESCITSSSSSHMPTETMTRTGTMNTSDSYSLVYSKAESSTTAAVTKTKCNLTDDKPQASINDDETPDFETNKSLLPGIHTFISACRNSLPYSSYKDSNDSKQNTETKLSEYESPETTRKAMLNLVETINTNSHVINTSSESSKSLDTSSVEHKSLDTSSVIKSPNTPDRKSKTPIFSTGVTGN